MKQGIEKIMQERWGFAHHQKTMLVDQDWHGQRYLTAYMGTRLNTQHSSLRSWVRTSNPAFLTACMGMQFNPSNSVSVVMASCPATFLCRCLSCHLSMAVSAEGLARYLGPADQHALVLSVSMYVSVSVSVILLMGTPMTAFTILLITFGASLLQATRAIYFPMYILTSWMLSVTTITHDGNCMCFSIQRLCLFTPLRFSLLFGHT